VVAVGVLLDTFLVRSVLVPGLVPDVGDTAWWPRAPAAGGRRVPPRSLCDSSEGPEGETRRSPAIACEASIRRSPGVAVGRIPRSIVGMDLRVADNQDEQRYEAVGDDGVVGFTEYRARPGLIAFFHTEVDARMKGQGVGSTLIGGALDDTRARGLAVLPFCPFVNGFIERHRDYAELVPEPYREQFGL
jgi:predicted GNAT family acetyltransferase